MRLFLLIIILFVSLFSRSISNEIDLTPQEKEFIKNTTIKVSITTNWPPFSFKEHKDEPLGVSSEYWELIVKKLNLKTENIFFSDFNQQLTSIKKKETDIILGTAETDARKDYSIFSNEYLIFPISIATKKDVDYVIESLDTIKDKKIAVGSNYTAHNLIKQKYPKLKIISVNSIKEGLDLVSKDKVFAFIDIKPALDYNIARYDFDDLKISGNTGLRFEFKFMIRDDYTILEPILNKAINSISNSEIAEIISRWSNVQFQTYINYEIILFLSVSIILIIFIFLYRNYVLNSLNRKLTFLVDRKTKRLHKINQNLESIIENKSRELIQKENILNHQSKMAAMGEMLENIAHQWRQPLSIISTMSTSLKLKKEMGILSDIEFLEAMDTINNSSQHLSNTIDDFRNFFYSDKELNSFFISQVVHKSIQLVKSNLNRYQIVVIEDIEEVEMLGYENELIQVILNLISNSIDILQSKSRDKFIFISTSKNNSHLNLTFKDSAGGIHESLLNRVFEPYFTTKHKSQGTGIGLYMSLEIVTKLLKGEISVSNKEFSFRNSTLKGAEFKLSIPISLKNS